MAKEVKKTTVKKTTARTKKPKAVDADVKKDRKPNGHFKKGNTISKKENGGNGGRKKIYEDPNELYVKCEEYFKWVDNNPWVKKEVLKGGERAGEIIDVPTQRPYTLEGLCQFLGITTNCWRLYEERTEFIDILAYVREKIRCQQLEGGLVNAFNSNLAAKILGLAERMQLDSKSEITIETAEERDKRIQELLSKMKK